MRSHKLGQYFRRRYNKLLGDQYSPKKVYIQSTDVDRTLASALAVLSGLYVPTEQEQWNKELMWNPIPVHTTKRNQDYILAAKKYCRNYKVAYENYIKNSLEIKRIYSEYAPQFLQWSEMTGANISSIDDIYYLHNTIKIEMEQHKP